MEETLQEILKKLNGLESKVNKIDEIESTVNKIDEELSDLKEEVSGLKEQREEDTKILRSLEHNSEVHKADTDNLSNDMAQLSGTQKELLEKLDEIKSDVDIISINTAKNQLDIAKIKSAK